MKTPSTIALAVGLAVALVAAAQSAAATPPTEPADSDGGTLIPAGFVLLTDDTRAITIAVPESWTDVETAPLDGRLPRIQAAPNRADYLDTFVGPRVTYTAASFTDATDALTRYLDPDRGCVSDDVQPYDDGVFVGSHRIYSHCGDQGTAEYHVIAANPANQAFTALLLIEITGPSEEPIVDGILDTFNMIPDEAQPADANTTTTRPTTVAAPATVPGTAPSGKTPDALASPSIAGGAG